MRIEIDAAAQAEPPVAVRTGSYQCVLAIDNTGFSGNTEQTGGIQRDGRFVILRDNNLLCIEDFSQQESGQEQTENANGMMITVFHIKLTCGRRAPEGRPHEKRTKTLTPISGAGLALTHKLNLQVSR